MFRRGIYGLAKALPDTERFGVAMQMQRAAVSLTNNIAEGHGRFHYPDRLHFLHQARGSLQELLDDLNVCLDEGYGTRNRCIELKRLGYQLLKRLNGYAKYLRSRKAAVPKPVLESPITSHQSPVSGFTLVELMLVVVIIGVLAATVVPRFAGRTEQAKLARASADVAAIGLALDLYELDVGRYPDALEELGRREPPPEVDAGRWNGPYLKNGLPKDPWGRPYVYRQQSQHHQDYDLASLGPDGQEGHDDVANWN